MHAFLDTVIAFPTVVFTVPLALLVLYWLMTIVGALDMELLDGVFGAAEGLDGLEALDGVDGVLDGADGALDALDGSMESADGALEAVDGAADAADTNLAVVERGLLAHVFHLGQVPVTITLSLFTLTGFIASYGGSVLIRGLDGTLHTVGAVGVVVAATLLGGLGSWVGAHPLVPMFALQGARSRQAVVGSTCEITTGRVDEHFGQAEVTVDRDHLLVQVRCDRPDNGLKRGAEALIISYDARREAFVVEPLAPRS